MRIQRLKLLGFKSFVDPTELVIEPGLTGVVGPNGCGKSNLLEALRWAMGETSHKSMRAASMDHVIFSGTNSRPSRNMAEVTMVLDNQDREAPAEFNDTDIIEVTRRIEREMGSAYRVNGREARARDIKLLFEDASTGARSPSLVRQGQIGDIVNAKPEARRRILEDAAGTAGLYTRRHEAELRLNAAEANLARLDDVVGGLNTQVESLKRQARQARRYKDLSAEIRKAEALFMFVCWADAARDAEACAERLRDIMVSHGEAIRLESEWLKTETQTAEKLESLREDEAIRAAILARKRMELEHFEREIARADERAADLKTRIEQVRNDIGREENFQTETAEIITRLSTEYDDLAAHAENDATVVDNAESAEKEAARVSQDQETRLSEATASTAMQRARKADLDANLARHTANLETLQKRKAALTTEQATLLRSVPAKSEIAEAERAEQTAEQTIATLDEDIASREARIADLSATLAEHTKAQTDARLALAALETERQTLATVVLPKQAGTSAAVVDCIKVAPGFETALGAALGDDLEATVDASEPIHWRTIKSSEGTRQAAHTQLPKGAEPLTAKVSGPPELHRRLTNIGVVAKSDGAELQSQLAPGQRLVSTDGDLWRWDGFVAASEGETAAARRLAHKNRLFAVEHDIVEARETAERLTQQQSASHAELQVAKTELDGLRQNLRNAHETLKLNRARIARHADADRAHRAQAVRLEESLSRSFDDIETATQARNEVEAELALLDENALSKAETELAEIRREAEAARDALANARATLQSIQRETSERQRRLTTMTTELTTWRARAQSAAEQVTSLTVRLKNLQRESQSSDVDPGERDTKRNALQNDLTAAERDHSQASDTFAQAQSAHKDAQKQLRDAQAALADTRELRARLEAENEAAIRARDTETQRIHEAFSVAPDACLELAEREGDAPLPERAVIEQHVSKMKSDRDRLGGVNLAADDDLKAIADEVARINDERSDVEEGVAKLRSAIQQLNREGRKRLVAAFESVDSHFQKLFAILFNGGEARLQLIESTEDPLQGGLEIIARPPGKKPATLSLLSGGEQTLTALSLIFAVFLTNPSPICVLDEVDAPLDDANVDRFCTMMERMAADTETRFLVITHHPMTMTRMNRLFGVTMAEKGVSQLVSVDLETAQGFREAS